MHQQTDKKQYPSKKDTRIRNVKEAIKENMPQLARYHLFPECSMPQHGNATKNRYSRVHYHGIILFPTPLSIRTFLLNYYHLLTGMSSIQLNPYRPQIWPEYCRKQKYLFPEHCFRIKNASWKSIHEMALLTVSLDEEEQ